ncbi:hypothetical protein ScPMuIL_011798 [Solemya velum]
MASRYQSMSVFTLMTLLHWVLVILLIYVSQDKYAEAACPNGYAPAVRMCENSIATNTRIFLDASSAEHVSATRCQCTLLLHGVDDVNWFPFKTPGYTACGTSIDATGRGDTIRIGCYGGSSIFGAQNSESTINITLNKPASITQSNAVDYCYAIYTDTVELTIRCCAPGSSICSITNGDKNITTTPRQVTTTYTSTPTTEMVNPTTDKQVTTTETSKTTVATPNPTTDKPPITTIDNTPTQTSTNLTTSSNPITSTVTTQIPTTTKTPVDTSTTAKTTDKIPNETSTITKATSTPIATTTNSPVDTSIVTSRSPNPTTDKSLIITTNTIPTETSSVITTSPAPTTDRTTITPSTSPPVAAKSTTAGQGDIPDNENQKGKRFPVEIVATVVGGVIFALLVIVVVAVCRKSKMKHRGYQNGSFDELIDDDEGKPTDSGLHDVVTDTGTVPITHYSVQDTGDEYAHVIKGNTVNRDQPEQALENSEVPVPSSDVSENGVEVLGTTEDDVTYSTVNKKQENVEPGDQIDDNVVSETSVPKDDISNSEFHIRDELLDNQQMQKDSNLDNSEEMVPGDQIDDNVVSEKSVPKDDISNSEFHIRDELLDNQRMQKDGNLDNSEEMVPGDQIDDNVVSEESAPKDDIGNSEFHIRDELLDNQQKQKGDNLDNSEEMVHTEVES